MTDFKPSIHPTSIIADSAQLAADVRVGAYCVIEDNVVLGKGCRVGNRVTIQVGARAAENNRFGDGTIIGEATEFGCDNIIHGNCVIGGAPLVNPSDGQTGRLKIGSQNTFRELTTIQVGSKPDTTTRIGDANYVMANVQIGHDVQMGNQITLSNYCSLSGHVVIENKATLGLGVIMHQHCRIGYLAMVGASAYVSQDIAPFVLVDGRSGKVVGLNSVGLKRSGASGAETEELKRAFRMIFQSGLPWQEILERLETEFPTGMASRFAPFLSATKRGLTRRRSRTTRTDL